MTGDPHGPNKFSNYMETHGAVMGHFVDKGFILENTLSVNSVDRGLIEITGSLPCLGDIRLDVWKALKVLSGEGMNAIVQTVEYRYNSNIFVGNVFRYDSPHYDHNQFHHVHRFDVFAGDIIGSVSPSNWPTLGEVLTELEAWHWDNYTRLYPTEELGGDELSMD